MRALAARAFVLVFAIAVAVAAILGCSKTPRDESERCARCGMAFAAKSPWEAEIVAPDGKVSHFDSPLCALTVLRGSPAGGRLRVREFYDTAWRDADGEVFVLGSDVKSPMGADLVPVDPDHAVKFTSDHGGQRQLHLADITPALLHELR